MAMISIPLGVVLLAVGQLNATQAPRLAVVDVPAVSERYEKTGDLEAHFEAVRRKLNEQREALATRIETAQRSLQEELKPGTQEFRDRRKQLAMHEAELKYFIESESREIEAQLAQSLAHIFADIHAMTRVVAEEKGLDLVMAADRMPDDTPESPTQVRQQILLHKLLYWSAKVDLTEEIVNRLNAKYKSDGGRASIGALVPVDRGGAGTPAAGVNE